MYYFYLLSVLFFFLLVYTDKKNVRKCVNFYLFLYLKKNMGNIRLTRQSPGKGHRNNNPFWFNKVKLN